jgi:hypothetical protein
MTKIEAYAARLSLAQIEDCVRELAKAPLDDDRRTVWTALCTSYGLRAGDDALDALFDEVGA